MINVMSSPLLGNTQARPNSATRHLPVARGRDYGTREASEARVRATSASRISETRLQAAVVRTDSSVEPYADVPCTD